MIASSAQMGTTPAYEKESNGPGLLAAIIVALVLAFLSVALRCYARKKSHLRLGADDWVIIASSAFLLPFAIPHLIALSQGYGRHSTFYAQSARSAAIGQVVSRTSYASTNALTKISILLFYIRLFNSKNLIKLSWVVGIFTVMYNMAVILTVALKCIPFSALWTHEPARCYNETVPRLVLGIVNVIVDVAILGIPVRFVVLLQMSAIRKVQLCAIFLTGSLVCFFGVARCIAISEFNPQDPSYFGAWSTTWCMLESGIGILAACLPMMRIFFAEASTSSLAKRVSDMVTGSSKRSSVRTAASTTLLPGSDDRGDSDVEPKMRYSDV